MLTHPRLFSHHLCSERVSVPTSMVSYYHQVFSLTLSHTLSQPCHPTHTPMVSSYHQVYPLTVFSHSHTLSHPCHPCEHFHGVVLPPSLPTHCSERTCAPTHTSMVSYYHQVITLTLILSSHTHFHSVVLPPSHHTHSHTVFSPTHTSMVSYYHQVYPLTALRELVLSLTLPWCRTTTKCTLTLTSLTHTLPSMSSL